MNVPRFLRLALLAFCIAGSSLVAIAACIGPIIRVSAASGSVGESVSVTGQFFTDGCNDVCFNGVCPPTYPAKGVKILFLQGDKTLELARMDAKADFSIEVPITIPTSASVGAAEIVAETFYGGRLLKTRPIPFTVR